MKILLRVGPSHIAGQGLFAAQNIQKDTRIIRYTGPKIPKQESLTRLAQGNVYIFIFNDRCDIDGQDLTNTARYINHSCDPNCDVEITKKSIWIFALRDIQQEKNSPITMATVSKNTRCILVSVRHQTVVGIC